MTDTPEGVPDLLAVVVMLRPEDGRVFLQWPPQLSKEGIAAVLRSALSILEPPEPKIHIALPDAVERREFAR